MWVYRITLKKHASALWAPGLSGRWNSAGRKVVYAASSISLAALENILYRKGQGFNNLFATMLIDIPDMLPVTEYAQGDLPEGWNAPVDYAVSQRIGDQWYDRHATAILKIPSAVIPQESNYVLHSEHEDFPKIRIAGVTEFVPDPRIEDILNKYPKSSRLRIRRAHVTRR